MQLRKPVSSDEKEIKEIINKNIASAFKTQRPFSELLLLNGCPKIKLGLMGTYIRKELLNEAKNGQLTPDTVMPRAYELIGEFLGVPEVKTFEDNNVISSKEDSEKLIKEKDIDITREDFELTNTAFESCPEKAHSTQKNVPASSDADELLKYAELYEKGLLTKEEFDMKKAELLANPVSSNQEFENGKNKRNFCTNCGTPIIKGSNFCTNCGKKLE